MESLNKDAERTSHDAERTSAPVGRCVRCGLEANLHLPDRICDECLIQIAGYALAMLSLLRRWNNAGQYLKDEVDDSLRVETQTLCDKLQF